MRELQCKDCCHFLQHYAFNKRTIFRISCGHCTQARAKSRRPYDKACVLFSPGAPDESAFVSKEYLSKELLNYMLSLDLLPEIEELLPPPGHSRTEI